MSRRWPIYEAAQAKRAEELNEREATLAQVIAKQQVALSKGRLHANHEIGGQQGNGGSQSLSAKSPENPDRDGEVQPVSRNQKRGRSQRKNVKR